MAGILALVAAGCGREPGREPAPPMPGGTLRLAILEPLDFLTPVRAVRPATYELLVHVTPPLGRVTEQGDIQWLLARAPGLLLPGLVFSLRPIYWEDGVRVTAHDFVRTMQVMLHPGAPGHERARFGLVRDVVALDDTTLYFDLLEYSRQRWRDALLAPLPSHVVGADADPRSLLEWPVTRRPMSCGPFKVAAASIDSLVLLRHARPGWPRDIRRGHRSSRRPVGREASFAPRFRAFRSSSGPRCCRAPSRPASTCGRRSS